MNPSKADAKSTMLQADQGQEQVQILCELVAGYQLSIEDQVSDIDDSELRPYCIVKSGGKIIHQSLPSKEKGQQSNLDSVN